MMSEVEAGLRKELARVRQKNKVLEYAARRRCCVEFSGFKPDGFKLALEFRLHESTRTVFVFGDRAEDILAVVELYKREKGSPAALDFSVWHEID